MSGAKTLECQKTHFITYYIKLVNISHTKHNGNDDWRKTFAIHFRRKYRRLVRNTSIKCFCYKFFINFHPKLTGIFSDYKTFSWPMFLRFFKWRNEILPCRVISQSKTGWKFHITRWKKVVWAKFGKLGETSQPGILGQPVSNIQTLTTKVFRGTFFLFFSLYLFFFFLSLSLSLELLKYVEDSWLSLN